MNKISPGLPPPSVLPVAPTASSDVAVVTKTVAKPIVTAQQALAAAALQQHGGRSYAAKASASLDADVHQAALGNLDGALQGALKLINSGTSASSGRFCGRLKAAVAALEGVDASADLGAARGLVAQMGASVPKTTGMLALEAQLARFDQTRVVNEVKSASPTNPAQIDRLIEGSADPAKVRAMLAAFYPGAQALGTTPSAMRAELDADLTQGGIGEGLQALMDDNGVSAEQSEALMGMMAEVRAGFLAGTKAADLSPADQDMQRTNWVHTRVEVFKAAKAFDEAVPKDGDLKAHGRNMMATLMGSLCSDAFKEATPHSLLWHNRPGAELVLPLLAGRNMDVSQPHTKSTLQTAMTLAHEHQITPAMFMSGAMGGLLGANDVAPDVAKEITDKLLDPLGVPQADGEIIFSPKAQAAMEKVGVPGWATMDPKSAHFAASQVVAYADVLQYVAPDGIIKIAVDIRSPDNPMAFMRDPNIKAAVGSSVGFSFGQGMQVIQNEELKAQGGAQAEAMTQGLDNKIYPEVERRLSQALGLPKGADLPDVPYWNADVPVDGNLSDAQKDSIKLVKSTLKDVIAEFGQVPLDPFGAGKE